MAPPLTKRAEIGPGAAPDVEHCLAAIAVEVDQPRQVMELLEVVLIQIRKELTRAWLVRADVQIMDVGVPVVADV